MRGLRDAKRSRVAPQALLAAWAEKGALQGQLEEGSSRRLPSHLRPVPRHPALEREMLLDVKGHTLGRAW